VSVTNLHENVIQSLLSISEGHSYYFLCY